MMSSASSAAAKADKRAGNGSGKAASSTAAWSRLMGGDTDGTGQNGISAGSGATPSGGGRFNGVPLSTIPGNPASGLRAAYSALMALSDAVELHRCACHIVQSYEHSGCSSTSVAEFMSISAGKLLCARPLVELQSFITNYLLKADGLGVLGVDYRGGRRRGRR